MKYMFLTFLVSNTLCNLTAQKSDNLISKLKEKLFHTDERPILFSEYIKAYDEACGYIKYDTSIQLRAIQPNPDTVSAILYQLMMKNDTSDFQPILALYHRQIEYFMVEWGPLYLANFYACDIVDQQYRILCEFENVLTSLKLKGKSAKELKSIFKDISILTSKFHLNDTSHEDLKKLSDHFSSYFRILRNKAWFGSRATFTAFEPYYDTMKPFIMVDFFNFKFDQNNKSKEYNYEYYFILVISFFLHIYLLYLLYQKINNI